MFSQAMKPPTQRMFLENQKSLVDIGFQVTGNHRMEAKMKNQKFPGRFQQNPRKSLDQKLTPQKIHIINFQALKCPESSKGYIVKPRQFALSPGKESPAYNPTSNQSRDTVVM